MMRLYTVGWRHVLGSRDKSYSLKHRPNPSEGVRVPTDPAKRIVFLRHGESAWNEVFNRGFGPSFPVRLISAWVRELMVLQDGSSLFLDSPLSATGEEQVSQLRSWLERGGAGGGEWGRSGPGAGAPRGGRGGADAAGAARQGIFSAHVLEPPAGHGHSGRGALLAPG